MTFQTKQFPRLRNLSHPLPNSSSIRRKGKLVRNESGNTPNELSQGAKKAARKLPPIPPPPSPPPPLSRACTTRIYTRTYPTHLRTGVYPRSRCKPSQRVIPRGNKDHSTCPPLSPLPPARAHFHNRRPPSSTPPVHPRYRTKKRKKTTRPVRVWKRSN